MKTFAHILTTASLFIPAIFQRKEKNNLFDEDVMPHPVCS